MRVLARGRITRITPSGQVHATTASRGQIGPIDAIGSPAVDSPALIADVDGTGDLVAICGQQPQEPRAAQAYWNDLRVSLSSGRPNTSPPTFGTFRGGVQGWGFAANSTEQLYFEAQVPHGWVIGSEIRPHIHWSPGNSTNTGSVVWQLEYAWANVGDPFPATTTLSVTQAAAGIAYEHQLAPFGNVDGSGRRESSVFVCRIARVGGDAADTFTGTAFGISVDFHHLAVQLGSIEEIPAVET